MEVMEVEVETEVEVKDAVQEPAIYQESFRFMKEHAAIRVMLASSYEMDRTGLRMLIESWPAFDVVAEADCANAAAAKIASAKPDVLLIDLDHHLAAGEFGALQNLISAAGDVRIVLLTGVHNDRLHRRAVLLGVSGVVFKDKAAGELQRALERVYGGERWINRAVTAGGAETADAEDEKTDGEEQVMLDLLTRREREVAAVVCEGLKNNEIGKRLLISETTVRHHLSSIFTKLNVSSRFELIVFLNRNKFFDLSATRGANSAA